MARKPMSNEQKMKARERMQAVWAKRRGEKPKDERGQEQLAPKHEVVGPETVELAWQQVNAALDAMIIIRNQNLDVIEVAQVVDALTEGVRKMGQVQGILSNK